LAVDELKVKVTGDTSGLKGALDKAGGIVTGFSTKISSIGKSAAIGGAAVTTAIVKTFKDFTAYETKLTDMAKVTDQSFEDIEDSIKGIDPILGNSTELLEGYYNVISAGVTDPIEALDLLTTAFETGKAAHVEQASVVEGITKMMAGFEGVIESASEAADLMFSIEKSGQTTVAALIPVIGGLAKMSSDLAILPQEMAASVAVVTKTAGSTAEAATQYQAILSGLMKPTAAMTDAFKAIGENIRGVGEGYVYAGEMIKDLGFTDAMKAIQEHSDAAGVSIADLFGRKEAMIGFSALGAEGFRTLDETIVAVTEGVGGAQKAFDEWSETGAAAIDGMQNSFSNLSVAFGNTFAPMVQGFIDKIAEMLPKIQEWVESHKPLVEAIGKIGVALAVGGPVLIGLGFLVTAITAIISPVGLVVIAIAALGVAWATNFLGIKDIAKKVIDYVIGAFNKLIAALGGIKDKIISIINSVKQALANLKNVGVGNVNVQASITQATGGSSDNQLLVNAAGAGAFHSTGIDYVPRKAFYGLDPGEKVLTASEAKSYDQSSSYSPTVHVTVQGDGDADKIKQAVNQALNEAGRKFKKRGNEYAFGM